MSDQRATVGRIVHYVLDAEEFANSGTHRPAIVVDRLGDSENVCLQVFLDCQSGIHHKASVEHDEAAKRPGTWHWPEREDG